MPSCCQCGIPLPATHAPICSDCFSQQEPDFYEQGSQSTEIDPFTEALIEQSESNRPLPPDDLPF